MKTIEIEIVMKLNKMRLAGQKMSDFNIAKRYVESVKELRIKRT